MLRPTLFGVSNKLLLHPVVRSLPQQRTKLCKKTLNPVWEEEFKFEVADDSVLQNEPIEFKVCINDTDWVGLEHAFTSVLPLL